MKTSDDIRTPDTPVAQSPESQAKPGLAASDTNALTTPSDHPAARNSTELLNLFGRRRNPELDLSKLPDFLCRYLELACQNTDARPGLLMTAFLPFCSVNLGSRVYMINKALKIYPNLWTCVIGRSGITRKTTALRYAGYTLQPYVAELRKNPVEFYDENTPLLNAVTLSKLMSYLSVNSTRLFVHHELSGWLLEMNKGYNAGYKQAITELYDGVDRTVATQQRSEHILAPALSIAAASTESWLYANVGSRAEQLGGFLQRMLFFVVRDIDPASIDLSFRPSTDLEHELELFEREYFRYWREIPEDQELRVNEDVRELRDALLTERYRKWLRYDSDTLMSYFTRVYDGHWFKFCILITLARFKDELAEALRTHTISQFFYDCRVDMDIALQAFYLCDFYLENTPAILDLLDEQDKLSGERRIIEVLVNKFNGRATHSALMNSVHMRKKEFRENIESLIEREAIRVETVLSRNNKPCRLYVLDGELLTSWKSAALST